MSLSSKGELVYYLVTIGDFFFKKTQIWNFMQNRGVVFSRHCCVVAPTTIMLFWHPRQTKTNQCLLQNMPHGIRKDCLLNNNAWWPAGPLVSQRQRRMRTTCQVSHSVGGISLENSSWSSKRSTNKSLPATLQGVLELFKLNLNKMCIVSSSKIPPPLPPPPPPPTPVQKKVNFFPVEHYQCILHKCGPITAYLKCVCLTVRQSTVLTI